MLVKKKINAGEPGSKKYLDKYGDILISIRYRYCEQKRLRLTTVELIEEKTILDGTKRIPDNKNVRLRINYNEYELREKIKQAGAKWNKNEKYWETDYGTARKLKLEERIIG
ncbi:MAG: hypothetical protein A2V66_07355 [Ignavibacteria bacterium RBG_13_36_8]|nr:MAG: hypothetical protein A2V66_07355 [Ignavibacteria bacterium RBG_13_36_8]